MVRIAKWDIELKVYNITFKPHTAIKAQALSNFIAMWTEIQVLTKIKICDYYTDHFDRSLQLVGAGTWVVLTSPRGEKVRYVLQIQFSVSNNIAEYETLLLSMRIAITLGKRQIWVLGDSILVINQVNKEWTHNDVKMIAYCQEIQNLRDKFDGIEFLHVLRAKSEETNI